MNENTENDMRYIIVTALKLMIIVMVSVSVLGYVNSVTEEKIARIEIERFENGLREVIPLASEFDKSGENVFDAYNDNGKHLGEIYLVEIKGYNDVIKMLIGIDNNGKIIKVKILKHLETPGVGARIVDDPGFLKQFEGKKIDMISRDNKNRRNIDAITGASISSNAVIEGVKTAIKMRSEDK